MTRILIFVIASALLISCSKEDTSEPVNNNTTNNSNITQGVNELTFSNHRVTDKKFTLKNTNKISDTILVSSNTTEVAFSMQDNTNNITVLLSSINLQGGTDSIFFGSAMVDTSYSSSQLAGTTRLYQNAFTFCKVKTTVTKCDDSDIGLFEGIYSGYFYTYPLSTWNEPDTLFVDGKFSFIKKKY